MHDPRESFRPFQPVILDFDGSVLPVAEGERRIPLGSWQEAIRFGCTRRAFSALEAHLEGVLPVDCGCAFMGSGDFHHVTLIPLRRLCRRLPPASLDVVVFDNHPDNMRYPFGIHCGSWVSHAALLPSVRRVHVIGITSGDIGLAHAWENRLTPFLRRKLTYWSVGTDAAWLRLIGRAGCGMAFGSADELVRGLIPALADAGDIYLSIDKDVFAEDVVKNNWDQGVFRLRHTEAVFAACAGRVIGADVCGDVSDYEYASPFKRFLSRLDGQEPCDPQALRGWQEGQRAVNAALLESLGKVLREPEASTRVSPILRRFS